MEVLTTSKRVGACLVCACCGSISMMQLLASLPNATSYLGTSPEGEELLPRAGFITLSIVMAMFTVPAIVLNSTVIVVSLMNKQLRQPLNYALVNMAVADLGTALTGGVLSVVNNALGYFSLGRTGCIIEGFSVALFGEWLPEPSLGYTY